MAWWWSWLLTTVGVTGMWLVGSGHRSGWCVGLAAQGLWISYGIATGQPGFIASAVIYGAVQARALWKWTRARRENGADDQGHERHGHR